MKFDLQKDAQLRQGNASAAAETHTLSVAKEPTQIMLYGYSADTQWAAISFYETVSGGMICEDYDRDPPMERRRLHTGMEHTVNVARRTLTVEERMLAMRYSGGRCWIKVTFDSKEAADRALSSSPHPIQGHWVYAQPFRGERPEADEPIPVRDEDYDQGLIGAARPTSSKATTLGPAAGHAAATATGRSATATLPRSFTVRATDADEPSTADAQSVTSTTASSATATLNDATSLRQRELSTATGLEPSARNTIPTTSKRFPDMQRTVLRPATEALLPQLPWHERVFRSLRQGGWIPEEVFGTVVPQMDNGEFDWTAASFYWKVCYWLDSILGTDMCGIKEA